MSCVLNSLKFISETVQGSDFRAYAGGYAELSLSSYKVFMLRCPKTEDVSGPKPNLTLNPKPLNPKPPKLPCGQVALNLDEGFKVL